MTLAEFMEELNGISENAQRDFLAVPDQSTLEIDRVGYLGVNGILKQLWRKVKDLPLPDRYAASTRFHEVKKLVETCFSSATKRINPMQGD